MSDDYRDAIDKLNGTVRPKPMTSPDMKLVREALERCRGFVEVEHPTPEDELLPLIAQALATLDANAGEARNLTGEETDLLNKALIASSSPPSPADRDAVIEECLRAKVDIAGLTEGKSGDYKAGFGAGIVAFADAIRSLRASPAPSAGDGE